MGRSIHDLGLGLCALAAVLSTSGLNAQSAESDGAINLTFGVYTTDKPTVMYRQFTPIVEAIENAMQEKLRRSVAIELRIFKNYEDARKALVSGSVDFVRFGPASYVLAKQENPKIQLLAMETKKGKKTFQGYIVAKTDSKIKSLKDLAGKRFAFGDPTSTIGRYLAQQSLLEHGIRAHSLKSEFLGRHDMVFREVLLGNYDAGALKSGTFHKLNTQGKLKILAKFDNVTKPWVGRADLPKDLVAAMKFAMTSIEDKIALEALKVDGLVTASDSDYDIIRASMRAARQFDAPPARPGKRPAPRPGKE